jgi:hypothetical protein
MGKLRNFDKINWKPFKKRINNIEVTNFYLNNEGVPKPLQNHLNDTFWFFEIILKQPNPYYGKESEYELVALGDYYKAKNSNVKIHKNCFKRPEGSLMIAYWTNINHDEKVPDLIFVGDRPFELDLEDAEDFFQCARIGQKHIKQVLEDFDEDDY